MNTRVCRAIGESIPHQGSEHVLVGRPERGLSPLALRECFSLEETGQPLLIYEAVALRAGDHIHIDDLEFSVDEPLSPDEAAQCIFAVCGGDLHLAHGVGETSGHLIYYSTDMKGLIGVSPKRAAVN